MVRFISLSILLVATALTAHSKTKVDIPSQICLSERTFLDSCKPLNVPGTLYEASKDVIVFITHGSQGVDERHHRYAKNLQSAGISSVIMDHWTVRGVAEVQQDFVGYAKRGANAHNMVIDIQHAVHHFRSLGYKKFGYIGESMGGGVAVLLTKKEWQRHFSRVSGKTANSLDAVVGLYGNCNERYSYDAYLSIPMLKITGSLDADSPALTCKNYISDWANQRGANMTFIELPGQHHDFDAGFSVKKPYAAQNHSKCISTVDPTTITSSLTGATYPNTPAGWNEWRRSCLLKANEIPTLYGNTGDPNTGFKEWTEFFKKQLQP